MPRVPRKSAIGDVKRKEEVAGRDQPRGMMGVLSPLPRCFWLRGSALSLPKP